MGQRPARRKCRPRHARMLGAATRGTKQQSTGLIAYPAAHRRPVSGCGSQRMLHALGRRSHSADHGPSFASLFPPLAAVSSAAIPVRVKLKIPRANAAAATTVDIPTGWDLQQRRPRPVADAGRSCWGSGQQDASAAQGTRGCWEPQPGALTKAPVGLWLRCCAPPPCSIPVRVKLKTPLRIAQRRFYDPYGNRTHVTAVKGPCLNRLTNGP